MRIMLKSKIHRARITDANLHYEGSLTLDPDLMEAADIVPFEEIRIWDVDNGARLETYAIEGVRGSGQAVINGAAARLIGAGDTVIIASFHTVDDEEARRARPTLVYVDSCNRIARISHELSAG